MGITAAPSVPVAERLSKTYPFDRLFRHEIIPRTDAISLVQ